MIDQTKVLLPIDQTKVPFINFEAEEERRGDYEELTRTTVKKKIKRYLLFFSVRNLL